MNTSTSLNLTKFLLETLIGIETTHDEFENQGAITEIIQDAYAKLDLHESGDLSSEDTIEAIHLTAEPHNVNAEYQGALDEVIHKFESDKLSAEETIAGVIDVHDGLTSTFHLTLYKPSVFKLTYTNRVMIPNTFYMKFMKLLKLKLK